MLRHRLLPKSDLQRLYRQLQAHPSEQSEPTVTISQQGQLKNL